MRAKHPRQVPTPTTHPMGGFAFPFRKNLAHLGKRHGPLPVGGPQLTPGRGGHLLPRAEPASPSPSSYLGHH